jgi:hypothetical protein
LKDQGLTDDEMKVLERLGLLDVKWIKSCAISLVVK